MKWFDIFKDEVDDAIDDLEEVAEEYDLSEHDWESVDDASDYLFEHKVKKTEKEQYRNMKNGDVVIIEGIDMDDGRRHHGERGNMVKYRVLGSSQYQLMSEKNFRSIHRLMDASVKIPPDTASDKNWSEVVRRHSKKE
mgnify:CR=1 FL=1